MWLDLVNIDGANWLNSISFWVLKAVYGLLVTLDSVGYHIYSYYDIRNQKQAKESFRNGCEAEEIFEGLRGKIILIVSDFVQYLIQCHSFQYTAVGFTTHKQ